MSSLNMICRFIIDLPPQQRVYELPEAEPSPIKWNSSLNHQFCLLKLTQSLQSFLFITLSIIYYFINIYNWLMKFVPLRTYIFDRLYHPTQGYFCKPNFQVGQLKSPLNFKQFIGYDDYQRQLTQKYPPNAWLTPCEIFKPYYGMTIANYLKTAHQHYGEKDKREKIRIVEAGAGTGSAAQSILYFFSNYHRELLPLVEYNIVQISPSLAKRIEQRLTKTYPHLIKNKQIKIVNEDISDYKIDQPCFALFFQVLDNLPHDKLLWNHSLNTYDKFVTVDVDSNEQSSENIQKDPLIKQCLQLYSISSAQAVKEQKPILDRIANFFVQRMILKSKKESKDLFLPTYLLRLMKRIKANMPKSHLVISDFDQLVTSVSGINAPIVSKKGFKSEQKKDYSSYLIKRGQADIFFPVDFKLLKTMHQHVLGTPSQTVKSFQFIAQFSEQSWAQTKSTFNPIRQDFGNTSFLVTEIKGQGQK